MDDTDMIFNQKIVDHCMFYEKSAAFVLFFQSFLKDTLVEKLRPSHILPNYVIKTNISCANQ
jgi:hypothetical protein